MRSGILLFLLCSALSIPSGSRASDDVGRYQLFQGEYPFVNLYGEEHWSRALFKIDTVTGTIYECRMDQVLGKHIGEKGEAYQRKYCEVFDQNIKINDYRKGSK